MNLSAYFTGAAWTYFAVFALGMAFMAGIEPIGRYIDHHLRISKLARRTAERNSRCSETESVG